MRKLRTKAHRYIASLCARIHRRRANHAKAVAHCINCHLAYGKSQMKTIQVAKRTHCHVFTPWFAAKVEEHFVNDWQRHFNACNVMQTPAGRLHSQNAVLKLPFCILLFASDALQ